MLQIHFPRVFLKPVWRRNRKVYFRSVERWSGPHVVHLRNLLKTSNRNLDEKGLPAVARPGSNSRLGISARLRGVVSIIGSQHSPPLFTKDHKGLKLTQFGKCKLALAMLPKCEAVD